MDSKGGRQIRPMDDESNCWALSPLQHLDELDMEITLITPELTSESIPPAHDIIDYLNNITPSQQRLLKEIGIAHIEDLASQTDSNWTPIAYAQPKLQSTNDIIRPHTYKLRIEAHIRPMMKFQHQGKDQQIRQFLWFFANSPRYCYKVWEENETKLLKTDPTQARGAGSIHTIPFREFYTNNNKRMLLLPGLNRTQWH